MKKRYVVPFGEMQGHNQYLVVNEKGEAVTFWTVYQGGKK